MKNVNNQFMAPRSTDIRRGYADISKASDSGLRPQVPNKRRPY